MGAAGGEGARRLQDSLDSGLSPHPSSAPHPGLLAEEGALLRATVHGWDAPVYRHPDHRDLAQRAAAGQLTASLTTLLSPFDPIVWDRRRALELFGFDYRLECFTPAAKRRSGYFTLPILRRGALVGRVDAKAHRRDGVVELKSLMLETGMRSSGLFTCDIAAALRRCARWHGCPKITPTQATLAGFGAKLDAALTDC